MKITYISPITIPSRSADSVQVIKACDSLQAAGAEVRLFIPFRKKTEKDVPDVFEFYECKTHFQIYWQKNYIFPERYSIIKIGLKAAYSGADVVFSRSIPAALIVALLRKKVVVEIHEPFDRSRMTKLLSDILVNLDTFKGVITNCEALKNHTLKRYKKLQDRCVAIQNGADELKEMAPVKFEEYGKMHVGYVGQLYKGKGVEVIRDLAPAHPEVIFHIVGGLPEDIDYWKGQLKNTTNVVFHGFVKPSELAAYITAFDVVLAPYQRVVHGYNSSNNLAEWTSPMKIFDYMSGGKPIIASDLPFMREVLESGQNAILCDPDDISAWSQALYKLSSDREFAQGLGAAAKEKFLVHYKWEKRAQKVLNFLKVALTK